MDRVLVKKLNQRENESVANGSGEETNRNCFYYVV
jgi:hypothetical protein